MNKCISKETHSAKNQPRADNRGHESGENPTRKRTLLKPERKRVKKPFH
jgi:hypothetical protein